MNESALSQRAEELLKMSDGGRDTDWIALGAEVYQGTVTLTAALYGADSPQLANLKDTYNRSMSGISYGDRHLQVHDAGLPVLRGALRSILGDLRAGMTGTLRRQIAGGILGDFIQLARAVLEDRSDDSKNVAAVLAAAAYEDTIRRLGRQFAGVMGDQKLSAVLDALKAAGTIEGPQVSIAQSYLTFRNQALHAAWDKIDRSSVVSVLGFVEQLLIKHFG
jgi:hypothetical protein